MADERTALLAGEPETNGTFVKPAGLPENSSDIIDVDIEQSPIGTNTDSDAPLNLIYIVIPMSIGIFIAAMDQTIIIASYAAIGSELKQLQKTSWIATSYILTVTSFQPLYGKLSDIFGRKACLLTAYMIFAAGCLCCGLARSMNELIAARALAGIGGGGMSTVVSIIMSDLVPLRSRGTWQGIINIVFATGSTVGAPLGGFLADSIGWRWAFLIQVPVAFLAFISVYHQLHLPHTSTSDFKAKIRRVDFGGAVTLVLSIFFLLLGLDRGGNVAWSDRLTVVSFIAFGISFAAFAAVEMEWATEPFAPRRIIVNRSLIAAYLVNFFGIAAAFSMLIHISLYLQAVRGMSAAEAGWWLIPSVLGGVTGSLTGGLIMQSTGKYYWLTVAGYILQLGGMLMNTLTAGVLVHWTAGIAIGLAIAGLGNGSGITTSLIALIANAGPEDQAIATAVSYLFRSLGSVIGLSVGSTILQDTLRRTLHRKLTGQDVNEIVRRVRESLDYVNVLDPETRAIVKNAYEGSIISTLWFGVGMSVCAVFFSFFIKEKLLPSRK